MLSTRKCFFEIPTYILFSVIAYLINFPQKNYQNKRPLDVWLALNVRVVHNSDSIWISIITFQVPTLETRKHKKISVVFDEGLQILVSSEKCICNSLFKVSIKTWQNLVNWTNWIKYSLLCGLIIEYTLEICRRNKTFKNLKNTYRIKGFFVFVWYFS